MMEPSRGRLVRDRLILRRALGAHVDITERLAVEVVELRRRVRDAEDSIAATQRFLGTRDRPGPALDDYVRRDHA